MNALKLWCKCRKCQKNILRNDTFDVDMKTLKPREKFGGERLYDFIAVCPHCKTRNQIRRMPLIYFNPSER